MQQQSNVTNGQKQNSILVLLLNWIIILGVYLLIRIVFIVLGFHLFKHAVVACPPCVVPAFGTNNA